MDRAPTAGVYRPLRASAAHRLTTLSGLAPTTPQALQQDFSKNRRVAGAVPRTTSLPTQDVTEAHIFIHPKIPELLNLQDLKGKVKPYQVKQLLQLAEIHNLQLEDES